MEEQKPTQATPTEADHLDLAEKNTTKFLDAFIDKEPEKMRSHMTEAFQANYDFTQVNAEAQPNEIPVSYKIISVSKEAGSFNVVADIVYEGRKNGKPSTKQFKYNLIRDHQGSKLLINSEVSTKGKVPFYKKPLFWILAVLGVLVILGGTYWFLQSKKTTQNQQTISNAWQEITKEADAVNVLGDKAAQDPTAFNDYSKELHTFANLLTNKKYSADQLVPTNSDKNDINNYKSALSSMNDYIQAAASQSDNIKNYSSSDNYKLNVLSGAARSSVDNFQNNAKYLSTQMPEKIYSIPDVFNKVKEQLDKVKEKDQAAKDAEAAAAAQDAANKTTVTNSVNIFQQGFIAGNAGQMRTVMTTGFQGEYNFNQLNPDQRQSQYPSSFRIISVAKQQDGTYKAQVNVLFKYTDNPNQYTQGYEYSIINQSSKWLLNNEKVGGGF